MSIDNKQLTENVSKEMFSFAVCCTFSVTQQKLIIYFYLFKILCMQAVSA